MPPAYIPNRRPPQSRNEQRKILETARKDNSLDELCWVVYCKGAFVAVPTFDGTPSIPAIPAGPDVELQRFDAEIMMAVISSYHPSADFHLELTAFSLLDSFFLWAEQDHICPGCAAIGDSCICHPTLRH